jgi:DHA2 family multidrug resistance protein
MFRLGGAIHRGASPRDHQREQFLQHHQLSVTLGRRKYMWIAQIMAHGTSDPATAHQQAIIALGKAVKHQALVMGFSDTFAVIGAVLVLAALAVLLTRKVKGAAGGAH